MKKQFSIRFRQRLWSCVIRLGAFPVALVVHAWAAQEPAVPEGYTRGQPWTGEPGLSERVSEIMARDQQMSGKAQSPKLHRQGQPSFQNLASHPGSPNVASWPPSNDGVMPNPSESPQSLGVNFTGVTLADTLSFPPDPMGAAGPSQFIVAVNGRIRSFNKATGVADGVLNANPDVFFSSVMTPPVANNFTSDPRIRYDRLSRRWFIIMIDVPGLSGTIPDRVLLAVSDGSIISAGTVWTFFYFQHDQVSPAGDSGKFGDYPTLGIDANALYIGLNIYGSRGLKTSFDNTTLFVVRKSTLLGGGPIVVTAFRGLVPHGKAGGPYAPQGVDNYDPSATEGYAIGVNSQYYGLLDLRRISNPGGTPAISGNIEFSIPLNGPVLNVPHLGNVTGANGYLDGTDYRLLCAHIRNGRLWTAASVGVDNNGTRTATATRNGARWYELSGIASGQTPVVAQSGTIFQSSPGNTTTERNYWMGTIMVSGQGHAAMGFSTAGANEYANAGTAGRLKNDPPGTMREPVLYTASASAYNPPADPGGPSGRRWGDFSYTCLDPNDDMTMWTIQEYCNVANSYGVRVARLLAPLPATPVACSPSTLTQGVANATLTLIGTSDGDTGFFDPGAGFSNRLAAALSGSGVTVNGVTYNNPTNLTLNVTVAGEATPGLRSVIVTNPDGQVAFSQSGILAIAAGGATNHPPVLPAIPDRSVIETQTLTFTNSASDSDGDALTYKLGAGAPTNAIINAASGVFTWTPTEAQGPGTNLIGVIVTDNGSPSMSATQFFTAFVLESNRPPVLSPISDRTVHAGFRLTFTNTASDPDLPANTLTFSLQPTAATSAEVNPATGIFNWQTGDADLNTTNHLAIIVTDNGSPSLSDTQNFTVTVVPRPIIQSIAVSNGVVSVAWSAIAGQSYRLQGKSELPDASWSDLGGDVTASGPMANASDALDVTRRFYRVMVVP